MKLLLLAVAIVAAGNTAAAQERPAIRPVGAVVAIADSFVNLTDVRHLSTGSVLVNDVGARRVVLLDSGLRHVATVADSTPATSNAYPGRAAGMFAYRGDSTLITNPQTLSMLVLDPAGQVARVLSVPRAQDAGQLVSSATGRPGFDGHGRIVYRAAIQFAGTMGMGGMRGGGPVGGGGSQSDSQPVVRVDLATRVLDTVGMLKVPTVRMSAREMDGRTLMQPVADPLPVVDDWVMLPDGTVAFIRGRTYHIDWIRPDGTMSSTQRIPFEWQRLSDDDKAAFIDSVKAARERLLAESRQASAAGNEAAAAAALAAASAIAGGGGRGRAGGVIVGADGQPGRGGLGGLGGIAQEVEFVSPHELPDYKPPFFAGASRADAEGNIWILTIPTRAVPGGPVYDMINRQGQLTDRVQVPPGRTILGFGAGVVYMTSRESGAMRLEKALVR